MKLYSESASVTSKSTTYSPTKLGHHLYVYHELSSVDDPDIDTKAPHPTIYLVNRILPPSILMIRWQRAQKRFFIKLSACSAKRYTAWMVTGTGHGLLFLGRSMHAQFLVFPTFLFLENDRWSLSRGCSRAFLPGSIGQRLGRRLPH